jgi:sarcosine oxidase subunit gamma
VPDLVRRSPLAERRVDGAGPVFKTDRVRLEHLDLGAAVLRCHPSRSAEAAGMAARATGWRLPTTPNTVAVQSQGRALWIEPGAWMICGARDAVAAALSTLAAVEDSSAGAYLLAADVTSGCCLIGVSGPGARALLETGCPVDLHPRVFAPGCCASSLFDQSPVLIDQLSDAPAYALVSDRALALGLWDQLADAARWLDGQSA